MSKKLFVWCLEIQLLGQSLSVVVLTVLASGRQMQSAQADSTGAHMDAVKDARVRRQAVGEWHQQIWFIFAKHTACISTQDPAVKRT